MRVLVPEGSGEAGKRVGLDEHEIRHLRVRRAKDREHVGVLDGAGLLGAGTLVQIGRDWMVDISVAEFRQRPPAVVLAVASGDRERFSWMVEKSVELGVTRIVPLETARTAGVATRLKQSHLRRLRRSALESIKQCGVAWAPMVEDPLPLDDFLRQPLAGAGWLADQQGAPFPAELDQRAVTAVIGPEGGLTEGEREVIVAAGYQPVALGVHTLRFETAALSAAAAITQARMRGSRG
jgi:16S rRNA (uracil1498-N3)-methyltransferase